MWSLYLSSSAGVPWRCRTRLWSWTPLPPLREAMAWIWCCDRASCTTMTPTSSPCMWPTADWMGRVSPPLCCTAICPQLAAPVTWEGEERQDWSTGMETVKAGGYTRCWTAYISIAQVGEGIGVLVSYWCHICPVLPAHFCPSLIKIILLTHFLPFSLFSRLQWSGGLRDALVVQSAGDSLQRGRMRGLLCVQRQQPRALCLPASRLQLDSTPCGCVHHSGGPSGSC